MRFQKQKYPKESKAQKHDLCIHTKLKKQGGVTAKEKNLLLSHGCTFEIQRVKYLCKLSAKMSTKRIIIGMCIGSVIRRFYPMRGSDSGFPNLCFAGEVYIIYKGEMQILGLYFAFLHLPKDGILLKLADINKELF